MAGLSRRGHGERALIAYALGYDDGQQITLDAMLDVVGRVACPCTSSSLLTWNGAMREAPQAVAENMRRVLHAGAVGINLEDSVREGERLFEVEFQQCARIRAVREMAREGRRPAFINARTDIFWPRVPGTEAEKFEQAVRRQGQLGGGRRPLLSYHPG